MFRLQFSADNNGRRDLWPQCSLWIYRVSRSCHPWLGPWRVALTLCELLMWRVWWIIHVWTAWCPSGRLAGWQARVNTTPAPATVAPWRLSTDGGGCCRTWWLLLHLPLWLLSWLSKTGAEVGDKGRVTFQRVYLCKVLCLCACVFMYVDSCVFVRACVCVCV